MKAHAQWWPVVLSQKLRNKALARQLFDRSLVLFRGENGEAVALPDRCPHRFAPLSAGKVRNGQIECPYHGWRFAGDGRCTRVPGTQQQTHSKPLLESYPVCEAYGMVWVSITCERPDTVPVAPAAQECTLDTFWITDRVQCSLTEAAENFLDGFHTHFVHAGWVRHDRQRQKLNALVRPLDDGIEAIYRGETKQSGLISRLFEGKRGISMGRFRVPCLAEIEYRNSQDQLSLLTSVWFAPCGNGGLNVFARVATVRGIIPASFKRIVLRRLFNVILRQDRKILERVSVNQQRFHAFPALPLDGPQDLLGPGIRALVDTGQPLVFNEREIEIWL